MVDQRKEGSAEPFFLVFADTGKRICAASEESLQALARERWPQLVVASRVAEDDQNEYVVIYRNRVSFERHDSAVAWVGTTDRSLRFDYRGWQQ